MGQKVNPIGLRIGINKTWDSMWYADKNNYKKFLHEDFAIRKFLKKLLKESSLSKIEILRSAKQITLNLHTGKPGLIIGRQGEGIEKLKEKLSKELGQNFIVNIKEIRKPDLDATLVADSIARQIEKRIPYRRASKAALQKAMETGAKGMKIFITGRLNGVEIARSEYFKEGNIPLHTLRSDIDYAMSTARTTYGAIGIKVWVYKGLVFQKEKNILMVD
ncbi:MAG: 30S ribosomal protein S3 [Candidatus Peregrinibacteria bacterium]|nr:30S ribosomal protein S3 [Candidatus Peregrinibacteria bacterium]MDZ4245424.1 30S ribosomal protein S3 [Candidatus Gracilibacteria bacterium]